MGAIDCGSHCDHRRRPGSLRRVALDWLAAKVVDTRVETHRVKSIVFERPMWEGHIPGQHVDIRLTAEDGYQAQRSYSIASAPEDDHLVLTVERLQEGEVSPYLFDVIEPGEELEMRGPIGLYFVWEAVMSEPLLMIAGGSGVVPFRAMLRHRRAVGADVPARLLYSARTIADVIYRDELEVHDGSDETEVVLTLTREQPDGWGGYDRRVDRTILEEVAWDPDRRPRIYVCGPTTFVELVAGTLVDLGHHPTAIRTERFGPTG
ncbi:MAG TPA: ferredoxin reductase [Acidimicrobiia bacterium]|nr:ferredoxin reductase [Acidimicrobiia bacterium]